VLIGADEPIEQPPLGADPRSDRAPLYQVPWAQPPPVPWQVRFTAPLLAV
jgi:hypothetical protein